MRNHIIEGMGSMRFTDRQLRQLIIPLIIEQLLSVTVGLADSVMVASVGEAAVSGVSLVDTIMVLIINIFAALATGGAVVAGHYIGQQKKRACQQSNRSVNIVCHNFICCGDGADVRRTESDSARDFWKN